LLRGLNKTLFAGDSGKLEKSSKNDENRWGAQQKGEPNIASQYR